MFEGVVERPVGPQRHHFQVQAQAPFAAIGRQAELVDDRVGLALPLAAGLVDMGVDVAVDIAALEALVAVQVEHHVDEFRRLHKAQVFLERAEAIVEHHADFIRRTVLANPPVGVDVVAFQVVGGHVPARLVEHFDGMQSRFGVVTRGQAFEHAQRVLAVVGLGVPFADILDPAVIETVLAAGGGVQVEDNFQLQLFGPGEGAVEHRQAAFDEGVAVLAVAAVVRIVGAEDPMADWDAHGVDAVLMQPDKILAGDERVPVLLQALRGGGAQFGAPGGFIGGLQALEHTGGHPFLQHQPATKVDAAEFDGRGLLGKRGL